MLTAYVPVMLSHTLLHPMRCLSTSQSRIDANQNGNSTAYSSKIAEAVHDYRNKVQVQVQVRLSAHLHQRGTRQAAVAQSNALELLSASANNHATTCRP